MACPITLAGMALGCKDSVGGIVEVYINGKDAVTAITSSGSTVSAITKTSVFKTYKMTKQTGMFESTGTFSDANDTKFYTSNLTMKFNKMEAAKTVELEELSKGEVVAIAKDNNGKYWLFGNTTNGATITALTAGSGTAFGDANQYSATLTDISTHMPYEVNSGIIAGLLA